MDFRILGSLEVHQGGRALPLPSGRHRSLLALLLLHANEVVPTDRLIDELWGAEPTQNAVTSLYGYISQLRKALGNGPGRQALVTRAPGYVLELEPEQLDARRFERLLANGRAALREDDPAQAAATLRDALALWRGPALSEFAFESFAQAEIRRLEELHLTALEERIEADLALGRHRDVIGELEALVAEQPLRERLRGQLMLALYRAGRQGESLTVYQDGRRTLVEQLGIEPSRPLQELEQAILRQDPAIDVSVESARLVRRQEPLPDMQATGPLDATAERSPSEERKVLSVLFIDLIETPARSGLADPEDVRAVLQPFHSAALREIERHGGTVEKLIGDEVIAIFGAPAAHEDDPERAVRAALAIRRWVAEQGADLQVRMAVNTGVAVVSLDARPQEGEALATGEVMSRARRMQAAAPLNGILVGEETYRATQEGIQYRKAPAITAGGKSRPSPVWEAVEARSRLGVDALREPRSPFVGRHRELDLLISTLARVTEEEAPELVTLVGVPGIGKSRLVFELANMIERDGEPVVWRHGRCLPYGDGVSFWALGEIVKAQAGILESDSPEQAEHKLHQAVLEVVGEEQEAPWVEQQLRPLVGAGGELMLGEPSGEAFAAWRRLLEGLAELRPLVLVFEDLQWADEGLLDFVDDLPDRLRNTPLLIVCTARPELLERRPGWGGGKANVHTISLSPLNDKETGQLVASVLEHPLAQAERRKTLLARAGGNPLYAEQFARVVTEIGSLDELPETVHGIIAARLDGLVPAEKALLQDAAVVGKVFWLGALEAIGGVARPQAENLLSGLERKEFVQRARRASVADEAEYTFRHVLLRDVAYNQIPRAGREERHRRAAAWIESLGRPEDHADMLAHHYLGALEYAKATGRDDPALAERARLALRAAGERAFALASYAAAARFYRAALEAWPEDDPDRVWLLVHAGRARHAVDGTGMDLLERGFAELHRRGDRDGAAEIAVELARCFWLAGERDAAYVYVDRALELAEGRSDSPARAHALVARAAYHMIASEHRQAIRVAREALPLTEALGRHDLQARTLDVLGYSRAMSGDVRGVADSKRAIALARENNAFPQLIVAEFNLHFSQFSLGKLEAASKALSLVREDVERYGTAMIERWLPTSEAHEAVLHGRWDDADNVLGKIVADAEAGVTQYVDPACHALRATIELARGDIEAASADTEKAVDRARTTKDPQVLAPVVALRGIVLVAQGRRNEASRLASEVLALGSLTVTALLSWVPAATPIEFAWLLRDLNREREFLAALEFAPSTRWRHAARAIVRGDFTRAVNLVTRLRAPSIEAYTRLRAAEALEQAGLHAQARDQLAPAVVFFRQVGATRFIAQAEQLLASA
jgi:DNA-binding SARP family transcriptional activator